MTAQINDRVFHRKIGYSLAGVSGSSLYNPISSGVKPQAACSACWRGYYVTYQVSDSHLFLSEASFWLTKQDELYAIQGRSALFPGITATTDKFGTATFTELQMAIPFTGGLLLADRFIRDLYVHMGFHPAWKYEDVHELIFEQGQLVAEHDRTGQMADLRSKLKDQPLISNTRADREQLTRWIEDCFSLNYQR